MQPFSFMTITSLNEYEISHMSLGEVEEVLEALRLKIVSPEFSMLPPFAQYFTRKQHVITHLYFELLKEKNP